jgi:ribosomal protein S27AE
VNTEPLTCPRCHGTDFTEIDCGPDSDDDDITYMSFIYTNHLCQRCGLFHEAWDDKWYLDQDAEEEYQP